MVSRNSAIWRVDSGQMRSSTRSPDVALIVEARHGIIGLRLELCVGNASARPGLEKRQPPAVQKIVDEGDDEDSLAAARQAGHAETHRRIDEARGAIGEIGKSEAGLVG